MDNYGTYLKALREANGLTLREVEKRTDISNAYLSQLEKGGIKQPSPVFLHRLAPIYGVSYETLMERVGYPVPKPNVDSPILPSTSAMAAKIGHLTEEEEIELINYLKFIRNRRK